MDVSRQTIFGSHTKATKVRKEAGFVRLKTPNPALYFLLTIDKLIGRVFEVGAVSVLAVPVFGLPDVERLFNHTDTIKGVHADGYWLDRRTPNHFRETLL